MHIGGVILGSGMELSLEPDDYVGGTGRLHYLITRVVALHVEHGAQWVILTGLVRPTPVTPWRSRRLQVRVTALKRSLGLVGE